VKPQAFVAPFGSSVQASAQVTACVHCSLPLAGDPVIDEGGRAFCCSGCLTVFGVLNASDSNAFYRLRGDEAGAAAHVSGRGFGEFDDPTFFELYGERLDGAVPRAAVSLYVEGVHCSACIWLVERLPRLIPGVVSAELDYGRRIARVVYAPEQVALSSIARGLDRIGYAPHPVRGQRANLARQREERRDLVRLGVAGALAMNAMLIAFALYGGILSGMDPSMRQFLRAGSLGLALLAVLWPGRTFLRGGWSALRTRTAHMDLPIAIGLVAGLLGGAFNTFAGRGEVYFESVALLVFFLLVGRYLQGRQQRVAQDSLELMHALTPAVARSFDAATVDFVEVPAAALRTGDRIVLRSGDVAPADGRVALGTSTLDLALLTGESRPVPVGIGDEVFAGCTNVSGRLELVVGDTGTATRLGGLMLLVEQAIARSSPSVRFADRMAGRFTWTLLALAGLTLAMWWPVDPARAVEYAVALLIVACPCALGLATPLAIVAAVGKAARRGMLIQGGAALERLTAAGTLFLDKTGTLTNSSLVLASAWGRRAEWTWIEAVERTSQHPLALAVCQAIQAQAFGADASNSVAIDRDAAGSTGSIENIHEVPGRGLIAVVEGATCLIGSAAFLREHGVELETPDGSFDLAALHARGQSVVLAARDGRLVAAFGFGNELVPEAHAQIAAMQARGWRVGILSGDDPAIVARVGAELGLAAEDVHGGVTPEGKLARVEAALEQGARPGEEPLPVVMVGDGVNDAAALAAATVGIAVHGGAEASLAAADIYMNAPGLGQLTALIDGARRTRGVIRRGLQVSLAYNSIAAALAMAGWINPIWAAILMPVSSLTVVSLAYRSRTFDAPSAAPDARR
jgi:P-type Cu2+ transporter